MGIYNLVDSCLYSKLKKKNSLPIVRRNYMYPLGGDTLSKSGDMTL
jgi:hypothetical protein